MMEQMQEILVREASLYPQELRQRINTVGAVTKHNASRAMGRRHPRTLARSCELTCGHSIYEAARGSESLPKRKVGQVVSCERCTVRLNEIPTPDGLLELMAARTRAGWIVVFRGRELLWTQIKPMLRPEVCDPRLDEFFEASRAWTRVPYESEAAEWSRKLATLPLLLRAVLRDPIQEAV